MKIKIRAVLIVILIICLVVLLSWYPFKYDTVDKYYCNSNFECVAEQCCHPTSCIHKNFDPDCRNVLCSTDCAPNTLDCGQGSCQCINNKCQAIIQNTLE